MKTTTMSAWTLGAIAASIALSGCGNPETPGVSSSAPVAATDGAASTPATPSAPTPTTTTAAVPPSARAATEILIRDFKYQTPETVNPGSMITVTNEDAEAHTITADTGAAFDLTINPGTSTLTAPTTPGTYHYHCIFHGNMHGTLTVK